jgi:hypothetical protein
MSELDQKVENLEGAQKSLETALKGLMDLMENNNKKLDVNNTLTDKMYVALDNHVRADNERYNNIKIFMEKIHDTVWGNGKPGIKTQVFVIWIGGSLLFSFVVFIAYFLFVKPQGG